MRLILNKKLHSMQPFGSGYAGLGEIPGRTAMRPDRR